MMTTTYALTVDPADIATLQEAIRSGLTTPELLAEWLPCGGEIVDDCLVVEPDTWHASDSSGCEIEYTDDDNVTSATEAGDRYLADGDWGPAERTIWLSADAWREAIDVAGEIVRVDERGVTLTLDPDPPACHEDGEHEWEVPYEIVGGIKENPGCWGHGGGVICRSVCLRCGCERVYDSWAQNPENGTQGLESTSYEEGKYSGQLDEAARECGEQIGREMAADDEPGTEWSESEAVDGEYAADELAALRGQFRESAMEYAEAAYDEAME